jgi:Tfp pilus assembly protein PilN
VTWGAGVRTPNLATRPFRNERLPALLLGVALLGLLALTVKHGVFLRGVLPSRTAAVEGEVRGLEQDLVALRAELRSLPRSRPQEGVLTEWQVIRGLVDQRVFSWARLLGRLEAVLPPDVRLVSIAPSVKDGQIILDIAAVGRSVSDGFGLMKALEATPDFDDVVPQSVGEVADSGGVRGEIHYTMKYHPQATPAGPAPAPEAVPAEDASQEGEP